MTAPGPLHGIRVADFTWVGAGPLATKQLAEFGADVVKVESSVRTDSIRNMRPFKDGVAGVNRSGYFANRNPNKRSILLDLSQERGRELALRLIAESDIVANNFTSGTMDRLGLGYPAVREVNPSIIYLAMPMIGDAGPDRATRGYGYMLAAMSGFIGLSGHSDGSPVGTGTNYPDHVPNPLHAAIAVLAALRHRDRTGRGQYIELSQLESTINVIGGSILATSLAGEAPSRRGNEEPGVAPHGLYPCAGPDAWCAIAAYTDEEWRALCEVLGADSLWAVQAWRRTEARWTQRGELDRALGLLTRSHEAWELARRLCAAGVAASVVQDARDVTMHDAQLAHRRHWVVLPHAEMGASLYDRSPAQMSRSTGAFTTAAPRLGEHTREVALDLLGLSEQEFEALEKEGIFQ